MAKRAVRKIAGLTAYYAAFCLSFCFITASALASGVTLKGPLVQGGLVLAHAPQAHKVTFEGEALPLTGQGFFVFGLGRDHGESAHLTLIYKNGTTENLALSIKKRDYDIERVDGLAPQYVEPPPETLDRIRREAKQKSAARPVASLSTDFREDFIWPVEGPISGVYGSQRVYNGKESTPHYGVDIAVPTGTIVHAPQGGIVTLAEPDFYFEGGVIFIDHGHGLISVLMHLSRVDVKAGQKISKGEAIAATGASGRASGPHLDWRMYWREARVDPELLVPPMPASVNAGARP